MLSPELQAARMGRITASAAHRIMSGWDATRPAREHEDDLELYVQALGTKPLVGHAKIALGRGVTGKEIESAWRTVQFDKLPQGLVTYAEELACEELFDPDPTVFDGSSNVHMVNGNEREADAVILLSEATGLDFTKTGEDQIHIATDGIGATPDGVVYDDLDLIEAGCEVKCRSAIHHARQLLIDDNASLIERDFERYCQIQVGYRATGAERWYSVNYNPLAKQERHRMSYCVIERDDAFLAVFEQRAQAAFEIKARFMAELNAIGEPVAVAVAA